MSFFKAFWFKFWASLLLIIVLTTFMVHAFTENTATTALAAQSACRSGIAAQVDAAQLDYDQFMLHLLVAVANKDGSSTDDKQALLKQADTIDQNLTAIKEKRLKTNELCP